MHAEVAARPLVGDTGMLSYAHDTAVSLHPAALMRVYKMT